MSPSLPRRRATLALVLGLTLAAPLLALASDFSAAQQLFLKAGAGDESAIDDAADRFARLSAAQPADPVLLAYAGASEALRARTTWLPWRKMRHADDGLAQIDKALVLVAAQPAQPGPSGLPAVLEVRFVAANTFLALPSLFHRHERGEKLLGQLQADPLLAAAPAAFQSLVQQRAARLKASGQ